VPLCADESGSLTGSRMDVCRRFLGGESLTCAELLDHSPLSPPHRNSGKSPRPTEFLCFHSAGLPERQSFLILESRREMLIPGKEVFRSMVRTLLLTVLIEMVVIVFCMVVTP